MEPSRKSHAIELSWVVPKYVTGSIISYCIIIAFAELVYKVASIRIY